jgi:hypothetical protein
MASIDLLELTVAIIVIVLSVYFFSSLQVVFPQLSLWIRANVPGTKLAAVGKLTEPTIGEDSHVVEKASPYSTSWWADDKNYQLERRAIFSKASTLYRLTLHPN